MFNCLSRDIVRIFTYFSNFTISNKKKIYITKLCKKSCIHIYIYIYRAKVEFKGEYYHTSRGYKRVIKIRDAICRKDGEKAWKRSW